MPLKMLPTGLKKLERSRRRPVALLSWLQPIEGVSDAVIVDSWADENPFPIARYGEGLQTANETNGYQTDN